MRCVRHWVRHKAWHSILHHASYWLCTTGNDMLRKHWINRTAEYRTSAIDIPAMKFRFCPKKPSYQYRCLQNCTVIPQNLLPPLKSGYSLAGSLAQRRKKLERIFVWNSHDPLPCCIYFQPKSYYYYYYYLSRLFRIVTIICLKQTMSLGCII